MCVYIKYDIFRLVFFTVPLTRPPCLASYNNILRDNSSCPDADRLVILSRRGRTRPGKQKEKNNRTFIYVSRWKSSAFWIPGGRVQSDCVRIDSTRPFFFGCLETLSGAFAFSEGEPDRLRSTKGSVVITNVLAQSIC